MKCIFTLNDKSDSTYPLLKAAINSLLKNTTLEPVVIWSGEDNSTTDWLISHNVKIIKHNLSFENEIKHFKFENTKCDNKEIKEMYLSYPNYYNYNFIYTESMRIDIPKLFDDKYVLYSDCDVLFLKDIIIENFNETIGAVDRNGFFNNGIMVFNMDKMKEVCDDFKNFYISGQYNYMFNDEYLIASQGAFNSYFKNKIHKLPLTYNWHVFWGINEDAKILHWCGPKPIEYIQQNKHDHVYNQLCENTKAFMGQYLKLWNGYAVEADKLII